jgi:predicted small metal-binding protein
LTTTAGDEKSSELQRKETTVRQVDCVCGLTLSGADDAELDRLAHEHVTEHHPNDGIGDDFIAKHIADNAKESASS